MDQLAALTEVSADEVVPFALRSTEGFCEAFAHGADIGGIRTATAILRSLCGPNPANIPERSRIRPCDPQRFRRFNSCLPDTFIKREQKRIRAKTPESGASRGERVRSCSRLLVGPQTAKGPQREQKGTANGPQALPPKRPSAAVR